MDKNICMVALDYYYYWQTCMVEKVYKRRVWVVWGNGFHMEPETQYATLFEILADENSVNET